MAIIPVHQMQQLPNIGNAWIQGQAAGRQAKAEQNAFADQARMRELAPGILAGDSAAYGEAVGINPQAAMATQGAGDVQMKRLSGFIDYVDRARATGNPQAVSAALKAVGPYVSREFMGGKPLPEQWSPDMDAGWETLKARVAGAQTSTAAPTGFREFEMTAQAAGLKPGTPEYQQAANIALGREGRAATGGFSFEMMRGADGRERPARRDPRTGAIEVYDESTGGFLPLGQGGRLGGGPTPPPPAAPPQAPPAGVYQTPIGIIRIGDDLSPEDREAAMAHAASGGESQQVSLPQRDVSPAEFRGNQFQTTRAIAPAPSGLGVSRTPDEQAALTTAAQEGAKLPYVQQELGMRSQAALDQKAGEAAIALQSGQAELSATRSRDADKTLALLAEAEGLLPGATGSRSGAIADDAAAFFGRSTEGAQRTAALKTIAGQLTSSMPRMQGPQSDKDVQLYKEMAGDLANDSLPVATRIAALNQIRSLNQKYAGQQPASPAGTGPLQVRSAEDYDRVPSGAIFIAPDGTQRRKR